LPKVVRDYRDRYRAISQVLDRNPEILDAVHQDLQRLSQGGRKGRKGDFTSENILRALIVQHAEGLPFREAVIRMGGDGFLQDFLRTRKKAVMDFTFLDKCFLAIRPETWKRVNELLGRYAVERKAFNPKVIRTDTTVVESNIHYPTVSTRERSKSCPWTSRGTSPASRNRASGRCGRGSPRSSSGWSGSWASPEISARSSLRRAIWSWRPWPWNCGPICRRCGPWWPPPGGRSSRGRRFRPAVLAADKGFCPAKSKFEELAKLVLNLAIPRRMQDFMDKLLTSCQAFRAGIEGTISGLKRGFRLFRCFFRGFKGFARSVGLGVFCHNLIVLAKHKSG